MMPAFCSQRYKQSFATTGEATMWPGKSTFQATKSLVVLPLASEISPAAPGLMAATIPRCPVSRSPEST
jgi:hypothetical protein